MGFIKPTQSFGGFFASDDAMVLRLGMDRGFPFQGNCSKDVSRKIENSIRRRVNTFSMYSFGGMGTEET